MSERELDESPFAVGGRPTNTRWRRLAQELTDILKNPPPLCRVEIKDGDITNEWTASIEGPPDTVYEGGVFRLSLSFPRDYPFKPPKVKFLTKIYHCNVNSTGNVCLDILSDAWSPAMTVSSLLVSISSLLSDCNPMSPLMGNIANLYLRNRAEHDRRAREHTKKHAFPKPKPN